MKTKIQFKEPDLELKPMTEDEREKFHEQYSEFGEYYVFELDTETLTGRLLPRSEW